MLGLNDNLFPFGTWTYPVTRGIRVELAVTVVFCLLGLLSQFKLWKLTRERREKQEKVLAEEQRKKDAVEVELGQAIEEKKENDLVRWEAIYGDKGDPTTSQTPRSEAQTQPPPVELVEAPDNSVEMVDLPATPHDTSNDQDIVEDENQTNDGHCVEKEDHADEDRIEEPHNLEEEGVTLNKPKPINNNEPVLSAPPPPPVTPLPFRVPNAGSIPVTGDGNGHSIQVIIDDIDTVSVVTSKDYQQCLYSDAYHIERAQPREGVTYNQSRMRCLFLFLRPARHTQLKELKIVRLARILEMLKA